jgi:hypothetical protein
MVKTYYINSYDDWEVFLQEHDLEISKLIIDSALDNLDSGKRYIHVIDVDVEEDDAILEITLDTHELVDTLKLNLKILEHYEEYEYCMRIKQTINKLESNG